MSVFALPREALGGVVKEMPERARQVAALGALVGVSSLPILPHWGRVLTTAATLCITEEYSSVRSRSDGEERRC